MQEKNKIKVLMIEPLQTPYVKEIENDYRAMQKLVGGTIQAVYTEDATYVMNDEGKLLGLPLNRALRNENGAIYDIIAGTFFVCGLGEENFASLTEEQIGYYTKRFRMKELFLRLPSGKIEALEFE